jgi:hypothetical protein
MSIKIHTEGARFKKMDLARGVIDIKTYNRLLLSLPTLIFRFGGNSVRNMLRQYSSAIVSFAEASTVKDVLILWVSIKQNLSAYSESVR